VLGEKQDKKDGKKEREVLRLSGAHKEERRHQGKGENEGKLAFLK